MEIKEIEKTTQNQIKSTEALFLGNVYLDDGGIPVMRTLTFSRDILFPGIERLTIISIGNDGPFVFGLYDRKHNVLEASEFDGLDKIADTLSFKVGSFQLSPMKKAAIAMELLIPILFMPNGDLNPEEMEQLTFDYSNIRLGKDRLLWFAAQIYANPNASFQSIFFSDINYMLWPNKAEERDLADPNDLVKLHYMKNSENKDISKMNLIRQIVFDHSGEVAIALYSAWQTFQEAKKRLANCPKEDVERIDKLIAQIKARENKPGLSNFQIHANNHHSIYHELELSPSISPLGVHLRFGENSSLFLHQVNSIECDGERFWPVP